MPFDNGLDGDLCLLAAFRILIMWVLAHLQVDSLHEASHEVEAIVDLNRNLNRKVRSKQLELLKSNKVSKRQLLGRLRTCWPIRLANSLFLEVAARFDWVRVLAIIVDCLHFPTYFANISVDKTWT